MKHIFLSLVFSCFVKVSYSFKCYGDRTIPNQQPQANLEIIGNIFITAKIWRNASETRY